MGNQPKLIDIYGGDLLPLEAERGIKAFIKSLMPPLSLPKKTNTKATPSNKKNR